MRRALVVVETGDGTCSSVFGPPWSAPTLEVTMIDMLLQQFAGSGPAKEALSDLTAQGLSEGDAKNAVAATADGAAQALAGDGGGLGGALGGLLGGGGGGGLGGALGGLLGGGGGGLGGALGGLLGGGGGGGGGDVAGIPAAVVDKIAGVVAEKTGLPAMQAKLAVSVVLPKVVAFVKEKMG